jgi:hypothetical protein
MPQATYAPYADENPWCKCDYLMAAKCDNYLA